MNELDNMRNQLVDQSDGLNIMERLDQISMFLEPTYVKGQEDYDNPRKPLVSKEFSVGNILENHMSGHLKGVRAALELLDSGQIGLARYIMKTMQSEFKMTMSIGGEFMKNITKQELRYTHTQHLHQHPAEVTKKKWGRSPPPVQGGYD